MKGDHFASSFRQIEPHTVYPNSSRFRARLETSNCLYDAERSEGAWNRDAMCTAARPCGRICHLSGDNYSILVFDSM